MSQSPPVAVCPGPDFLALLAVLGAEFGGSFAAVRTSSLAAQ